MPRGGKRLGAGRKHKWNSGETRTIRIPVAIADLVLEIAQGLDSGLLTYEQGVFKENNVSKTIRLSHCFKVYQEGGQEVIKLSDFLQLMQVIGKAAK